jgi:hypothetical protein
MNPEFAEIAASVENVFEATDELRRINRTGQTLHAYVKNLIRLGETTGDRRYIRMAYEARNDLVALERQARAVYKVVEPFVS